MNKAFEHLDGMMNTNTELYEKILDTPGFAYHFNELVKLAQSAAQQRGLQSDGAKCAACGADVVTPTPFCLGCGLDDPPHR